MREPHVVALHYRLETGPQLAFNSPLPVKRERDSFSVCLANNQLRVVMKDHFATADAARREVEPYLRSWEIATGLKHGPRAIHFTFDSAETEDRNPPPPGTPITGTGIMTAAVATLRATATVTSRLPMYPDPPDLFTASLSVFDLWGRYLGYLDGKEPLPSMAYYLVTAFQQTEARGTVSDKVLSHLRCLATMVGTPETFRKREAGQDLRPHTPAETAWMEAVVKRIIQRVGECAAAPNAQWPQITMEDFPKL